MTETPFNPEPAAPEPAPIEALPVEAGPAAPLEPPALEEPTAVAEPPVVAEPVAVPEPMVSPAPEPEPAPIPVAASPEPPLPAGVAASLSVPPLESAEGGEGGEWELLTGRLRQWFADLQIGELWERYRGSLRLLLWVVAVLVALRAYGTVVGTIDAIPVVSGLLELVGLIVACRWASRRLLPRQERQQVLTDLASRWRAFRGQG